VGDGGKVRERRGFSKRVWTCDGEGTYGLFTDKLLAGQGSDQRWFPGLGWRSGRLSNKD